MGGFENIVQTKIFVGLFILIFCFSKSIKQVVHSDILGRTPLTFSGLILYLIVGINKRKVLHVLSFTSDCQLVIVL